MGILKDKFDALKATLEKAIAFADPEKAASEAEAAFKAHLVAEFDKLEVKVKALEAGLTAELAPTYVALAERLHTLELFLKIAPEPAAPPAAPKPEDPPAADASPSSTETVIH